MAKRGSTRSLCDYSFWFHWRGWNLLAYTSPNPVPLAFVTTRFFRELKGTFYFNMWSLSGISIYKRLGLLWCKKPCLHKKTIIYSNIWLQITRKHLGYLGIASSSHKHRCQSHLISYSPQKMVKSCLISFY